jgi:hypothetical protein
MSEQLVLSDLHRSVYAALVRDTWTEMQSVLQMSADRTVTPEQDKAVFTVLDLLETWGKRL